jgi:hypothetical protein
LTDNGGEMEYRIDVVNRSLHGRGVTEIAYKQFHFAIQV